MGNKVRIIIDFKVSGEWDRDWVEDRLFRLIKRIYGQEISISTTQAEYREDKRPRKNAVFKW